MKATYPNDVNEGEMANENIYSEAFPDKVNGIDITELASDDSYFTFNWLDQLLHVGEIERSFRPADFHLKQQISQLYFESRNLEKTKGQRSLGFGYPLFYHVQKERIVVAPVFIWRGKLEPHPNKRDTWNITRQLTDPIHYNHFLDHYLKDQFEVDMTDRFIQLCSDGLISAKELANLCRELSEKLPLGFSNLKVEIRPFPELSEFTKLGDGGMIWSGIFGLFPPQMNFEQIDIEEKDSKEPTNDVPSKSEYLWGMLDLDPFQATVVQQLQALEKAIVEGGIGTGKTHLLTYLLSNAATNGLRSLVISPSLPTLKEIQNTLSGLGLEHYQFLLRDLDEDIRVALKILKAKANSKKEVIVFDEDQFRLLDGRLKREHQKLESYYQAIKKRTFGTLNWTETVGEFLNSNQLEGKELLNSQLSPGDFQFNFEEFETLDTAIEKTFPLFQKNYTLKHPLQSLNAGIFLHKEKEEGENFIQQLLRQFTAKASRLQHRYINKLNTYVDQLTNHYEQFYQNLALKLERLQEKLSDYKSIYGEEFAEISSVSLRVYGVFSEKYRNILENKEEVQDNYKELQTTFEQKSYFDFKFLDNKDRKDLTKLQENLKDFGVALHRWQDNLTNVVQEETNRLSQKTTHPSLRYQEQIQELEYALDLLLDEVNGSGLYQLPLENKMLTLPKRQKYLEEIIEQLETTQLNMRDYNNFYDWQRNWFKLSDKARRLIKALIKVSPENWRAAFKSWYLNNCLTLAHEPNTPNRTLELEEYQQNNQKVQHLLLNKLKTVWGDRQETAVKQLKKKDNDTFQYIFGKKEPKNNLRKVFKKGMDAISSFLPMLITNLDLALQIEDVEFDLVLVDESQDMPAVYLQMIKQLGRRVILFGNPKTGALKTEDAAITLAQNEHWPKFSLQLCHRPNPGNIQQLLIGLPVNAQPISQFKLHFEQLDGRFDEASQTNEAEAQHLIRCLNEIKETPQRTFPKVGIVCFTKGQRDLISQYLLNIKQDRQPGAEKIKQLERNGLGVFSLQEIGHQTFEVLLISSTYGVIDLKSSVPEALKQLNTTENAQLIRQLMGAALEELFIVNSIPEELLTDFMANEKEEGTFLLAAYFNYVKAIQGKNTKTQKKILRILQKYTDAGDLKSPSLFLNEVKNALKPYIEASRILQNVQIGQFFFPLIIQGKKTGQDSIIVQADGFFAHSASTDPSWEYERQNALRKAGYRTHSIWSTKWWRNPEQEARLLASVIIKMDDATF